MNPAPPMTLTQQLRLRHRDLHPENYRPGYQDPVSYKAALYVVGMSGMGDNIHQRALVRRWLERDNQVWIETPWPVVYRDFPGVRFAKRHEVLRTQARNVAREAHLYDQDRPPPSCRIVRVSYAPRLSRIKASLLDAMATQVGENPEGLDFRLDVPTEWQDAARALLRPYSPTKPILVYRPLVERTEWTGCKNRNPDFPAYVKLFESIRKRYFVVSIADLVEGVEWVVGKPIRADVEFHRGELTFELLAGMFAIADLSFASPGFAGVLSQAVGTATVCVFGGFETSGSLDRGALFTPTLALGPGCGCFSHTHSCRKDFDVEAGAALLKRFSECQSPTSRRLIGQRSTGKALPLAL